ncbi:TetR/AcrR family transcriptional regulator [Streptomyces cacaoi]|uniref:TetR/AcrR family transcriptional regulator n=1 Tax=Streptomyces cacaoi TaxID=1898 RepID=UPI0011F3644E|nr:TetR/AcrR family transcriptional regulator [Streptomyces cacaoi]
MGNDKPAGGQGEGGARLPLRERKKLRTRETLIDTALELFTARGFGGVTLDELCDTVETSKRTFFRHFTSKEDVAMAPTQDLWLAWLEELRAGTPDGRTLLDVLRDSLLAALERMRTAGAGPEGTGRDGAWAGRVLLSRQLAGRTPSMNAHGLRFCEETSHRALAVLDERFGLRTEDDPRPRLAVDMVVAAFHWAMESWVALAVAPGPADASHPTGASDAPGTPGGSGTAGAPRTVEAPGIDELAARTRAACAALPESLTLTVDGPRP